MNILNHITNNLRTVLVDRWKDWSGRSNRPEYWFFSLYATIIMFVLMGVDNLIGFTFFNWLDPWGTANTGIASPIDAYNIQFVAGDISNELKRGTDGTAGAVETLLSAVAGNATVVAYQADLGATAANSQVSVILERSSWESAAAMQIALRATLASNIGANGPMTTTTMDVRNSGLKLA